MACRSEEPTLNRVLAGYIKGGRFGQQLMELRTAFPHAQLYDGGGASALRVELDPQVDSFDSVAFMDFDEPFGTAWRSWLLDRPSDRGTFQAVLLLAHDSIAPRLAHARVVAILGPPTRTLCTSDGTRRRDIWETGKNSGVALFYRGRVGHMEPTMVIAQDRLGWWVDEIGYYSTNPVACTGDSF